MKVLILGDSWAADWSQYHSEYLGWPNILAEQYDVTNIAQAGVSQYSILKQFDTVDLRDYDHTIISITSPYRLYTRQHPHHKTGLHRNADLIYADCEYHAGEYPDNESLVTARNYFKYHFDTEYAEQLHHHWVDRCLNRLEFHNTTVTSNIADNSDYVGAHTYLDGHPVWHTYPGKINHMSAEGNEVFARNIEQLID